MVVGDRSAQVEQVACKAKQSAPTSKTRPVQHWFPWRISACCTEAINEMLHSHNLHDKWYWTFRYSVSSGFLRRQYPSGRQTESKWGQGDGIVTGPANRYKVDTRGRGTSVKVVQTNQSQWVTNLKKKKKKIASFTQVSVYQRTKSVTRIWPWNRTTPRQKL